MPNISSQEIISSLSASDPVAAWHAAKAAGEQRIVSAIPHLFVILEKPSPDLGDSDLRRIAVWSLSQFEFETLRERLMSSIESPNWLLREAAADLLGFYPENAMALDLAKQLFHDACYEVRLWAALSLAKHGNASLPFLHQQRARKLEARDLELVEDALMKIDLAGHPRAS